MEQEEQINLPVGKWCKKTGLALISVVLIILILLLTMVVWVATGPRSLKQFTPQISEQINQQLQGYHLEMGDILLTWDGWQSPLDAKIVKVKLFNSNKQLLAELKEVDVTADAWAMMRGQIRLDGVTLIEPTIDLYRKQNGELILDLGYDSAYGPELPPDMEPGVMPLSHHLSKAGIPDLLGLEEINIRNGKVNIGGTNYGTIARLDRVNMQSEIYDDVIEVSLSTKLVGRDKKLAPIQASLSVARDSLATTANLSFENIEPSLIQKIQPNIEHLKALQFALSGNVSATLDEQGVIQQANFDITTGAGLLKTDFFKQDIEVKKIAVKGHVPSQGSLVVSDLLLETSDLTVSGGANVSKNEQGQRGVEANLHMSEASAEQIDRYWPVEQSPVSRDWVVSNLSNGKITEATMKLAIKPGMLEEKRMPNKAVDVSINFTGVDVRFLPEFEKLKGASGRIKINANELHADIDKASFLTATNLSKGKVFIDDLNADNPNIKINFFADTPAKELAKVLSHPFLEVSQELNLAEETIAGKVYGGVEIEFPFTLPRGADGKPTDDAYSYEAHVQLFNVDQPQFLGEYDLSKINGELEVSQKEVKFEGNGEVFAVPLQVDVNHKLRGQADVRTNIKAAGNVDNAFLKRFGVDVGEFVDGSIGTTADIQLKTNKSTVVSAETNLTNATLNVKEFGWQKEASKPASLNFVAENNELETQILSASFKSGTDVFEGSLTVDANGKLAQITATELVLGDNQLKLSYAPIPGGYKIYAQGNYFDASGFFDDDDDDFSFKEIPALDVLLDLKRLVLDDGRYIDHVNGRASCTPLICESVEISGKVQGAKPVVMSIKRENSQRRLKITSEDAGSLLKGLHVYENMENGRINIDGVFDDADPNHPLIGKIHIWDFQVKNTPILARIVTLATFGGILDALQGNGLTFKKMKGDFTLLNDVINVTELRATGDSIGITSAGEVNLTNDTLFLKGVVIPSYTINSFLKDVPIVGDILTGGEAIIAANYKVSGSMDDPEVSVNPLSALAPGFLRKIFE